MRPREGYQHLLPIFKVTPLGIRSGKVGDKRAFPTTRASA